MTDDELYFRAIAEKVFAGLFSLCNHTLLYGLDVAFGGYDL